MMNARLPLLFAYACTLSFSCVQMVLYTTIPYIAEKTGVATASIIGAISIGSFFFSGFSPFWSSKSDSSGRKKILSIGMGGMVLSFIAISMMFIGNDTFPIWFKTGLIVGARIIYGMMASAVVPVSQAWQLDLRPGVDRIKVMTRNSMCLNLGRILGPILILTKQVNFEIIIFVATGWLALLFLGLLFFTRNVAPEQTSTEKFELKRSLLNWKELAKGAKGPILLSLIFTGFTGIMHSFLGHHLKVTLSLPGDEASVLMAQMVLALSFAAVLIQQASLFIPSNMWKLRLILGAVCLVAGSMIMAEAASKSGLWLSIGFVAIAVALIPPVYLSLLGKNKNSQGKKLGLASISHSLGYAMGAGLIAISMKMTLISEMSVVLFVSVAILAVVSYIATSENKPVAEKATC